MLKDVKMTRPLLTQSGDVVPESHLRLSHVLLVGQAMPTAVHMYAHPYGNLEIEDLFKYLHGVVEELGMKNGGVFGIANLGKQISFVQIGGVPHGHPGNGTGS